jgi:hypothetical protein
MHLAYLPIRWQLRIGPRTSDDRIETALIRWRWRCRGDMDAVASLIGVTVDFQGRKAARDLLLRVVDEPHPPVGWWGDEGAVTTSVTTFPPPESTDPA